MARSLDERAVLRTAQLGLVLAFTSNLVSAAALVVAARSLKVNEEYAFVAREPVEPAKRAAPSLASVGSTPPTASTDPEAEAEAEAEAGTGPLAPLTEEQRAVFLAAPEDGEPEELGGMRDEVYGRHYLASDEWNPQMFYESIKDHGGAYAGVGTDQAYLFSSWARSELVWAIDYDPMVKDLHQVYADFFKDADTPQEFLELWDVNHRKRALRLLYELHPDAAERRPLRTAYLRGRVRVNRRLEMLRGKLTEADIPSYLTDQEHYDYVRALFEAGRVRPMLVDLTGDKGMRGIAEACDELGIPLRVLYLSNAEQYWKYGPEFRENLAAFEFDDASVVLRTISSRKANADYRYNVHLARDFQQRLQDSSVRQVYQFVELRRIDGRDDIDFSITPPPEEGGASAALAVPAAVGAGQD
jgi:hypothetical protein